MLTIFLAANRREDNLVSGVSFIIFKDERLIHLGFAYLGHIKLTGDDLFPCLAIAMAVILAHHLFIGSVEDEGGRVTLRKVIGAIELNGFHDRARIHRDEDNTGIGTRTVVILAGGIDVNRMLRRFSGPGVGGETRRMDGDNRVTRCQNGSSPFTI